MTSTPQGHEGSSAEPRELSDIPKAGWRTILVRAFRQFRHDHVTDHAAALTYFGILAIFPALLVLVSIMGLFGKSTTTKVLNNVDSLAPGGVASFLHTVITQVQGRAGMAGVGAVIGLVIALWSASGYVAAFMRAANSIYEIGEGRPIWRTIPVRILTTLAVVVMLVICVVIILVTGPIATQVGKAFGIGNSLVLVWQIAKWPVLLIVVSLLFAVLYRVTPNVKQPGFRWLTPGGVLAVVLWLIASGVFALYVSFSSSYNKTYGSLATVIIFLVWLWISNIAVLLGLEFDAETEHQRAIHAGLPPDVEPFAEPRDTRKMDDEEKERVEAARKDRDAAERRGRHTAPRG